MQTSAQHQELMKKVETLNVLSDSNRLQREEKERLQQQNQQMEAKVINFECIIKFSWYCWLHIIDNTVVAETIETI